MALDRRGFLGRAAIALGAGIFLPACGTGRERSESAAARNGENDRPGAGAENGSAGDEWEILRRQFEVAREPIDMSALLIASNPRPVREAIERYRRELNKAPTLYLESENGRLQENARRAAAEYLGTSLKSIALTDSTTMGVALMYHGLRLERGQEILTTRHDYYVTHESLRLASLRSGATVRQIELFANPASVTVEEIVSRFEAKVSPSTRVVALTWVHSGTGIKLPLAEIAGVISERNRGRSERDRILLCVDGVHGFGVEDADPEQMGCDFFAAGCHKWLFGPRGTGILWGRSEAFDRTEPVIPTFMETESWSAWAEDRSPLGSNHGARMTPGGFKAFEHQWALPEAFRFHLDTGKAKIADRTHALASQLKEGMDSMTHVQRITPLIPELSSGIVCFEVEGQSPQQTVQRLRDRGVVSTVTPYALPYARLTPSIRNSPEEVDQVLREIAAMA